MITKDTTMTIRLAPQLKKKLGRLAKGTQRSRSFLAAAAIAAYVDRELAILDGLTRGSADVKAGRTMSHEDAMTFMQHRVDRAAGEAK